jgi:hypothetical protein
MLLDCVVCEVDEGVACVVKAVLDAAGPDVPVGVKIGLKKAVYAGD